MIKQFYYSLSALIIAALLSGCGDGGPTIAEQHDEQVESVWIPGRSSTDAIAFLEQGGIYENASTDEDIDRSYILPLMKRLSAESGLKTQVLLDEPNVAFAIVVDISELTADDDRRAAVVDAIQQADDEFSGLLIDK